MSSSMGIYTVKETESRHRALVSRWRLLEMITVIEVTTIPSDDGDLTLAGSKYTDPATIDLQASKPSSHIVRVDSQQARSQ
jgi:hypothetical protein